MSVQAAMEQRLTAAFAPLWLQVENESHQHSSGKGSESHFKVTLVSAAFEGMALLARHRAVQAAVKEVAAGVHALGLHTYTPAEWQARGGEAPDSPRCAGGGR